MTEISGKMTPTWFFYLRLRPKIVDDKMFAKEAHNLKFRLMLEEIQRDCAGQTPGRKINS